MSHRIVFKGGLPDEFMDDLRGEKLSQLWKENKLTGIVDINGNTYDAKSIKAILSGFANPDSADRNTQHMKEIQKIREDHDAAVTKKLSQSPAVRAKNTGLAEVIYMGFKGTPMPQELKNDIIKAQEVFFKEHPNYAEANPICYRDLIGPPTRQVSKDAPKVSDLLPSWSLNFAERVVSAGIL